MIKQAIITSWFRHKNAAFNKCHPKELLPINGKPNLEYILEECLEAGIKKFILIISKKKKSIKNYFYNDKFYENILKKKKIKE